MSKKIQLSCPKMTVLVEVSESRIVDAAPIVRKFIGQPIGNLMAWLKKFGEVDVHTLPTVPAP